MGSRPCEQKLPSPLSQVSCCYPDKEGRRKEKRKIGRLQKGGWAWMHWPMMSTCNLPTHTSAPDSPSPHSSPRWEAKKFPTCIRGFFGLSSCCSRCHLKPPHFPSTPSHLLMGSPGPLPDRRAQVLCTGSPLPVLLALILYSVIADFSTIFLVLDVLLWWLLSLKKTQPPPACPCLRFCF